MASKKATRRSNVTPLSANGDGAAKKKKKKVKVGSIEDIMRANHCSRKEALSIIRRKAGGLGGRKTLRAHGRRHFARVAGERQTFGGGAPKLNPDPPQSQA